MAKQWYVVHTYSGFEKRVKEGIEMRVEALGLQDEVGEILIPTENIIEMKGGKKVITTKKFFPGYILVEAEMSDKVWHVIRGTPKVTGFVGSRKTPTPLTKKELGKIKEQIVTASEKPRPKFDFKKRGDGQDYRRTLHQLHRQSGRGESGAEHLEDYGHHLWQVNPGRARFSPGGEAIAEGLKNG